MMVTGSMQVAKVVNSSVYYTHADHLGSVRMVTSGSGQTTFATDYVPYGTRYGATGTEVFSYTGKPYDGATGLYYFGARYYDPAAGRFVSEDAYDSKDPLHLNKYCYADENPLRFNDPSGHMTTLSTFGSSGFGSYFDGDEMVEHYLSVYLDSANGLKVSMETTRIVQAQDPASPWIYYFDPYSHEGSVFGGPQYEGQVGFMFRVTMSLGRGFSCPTSSPCQGSFPTIGLGMVDVTNSWHAIGNTLSITGGLVLNKAGQFDNPQGFVMVVSNQALTEGAKEVSRHVGEFSHFDLGVDAEDAAYAWYSTFIVSAI